MENRRNKEVIVDWENGTWVACNSGTNRAEMYMKFAQLYLVIDKVNKLTNKSMVSVYTLNFKQFEHSHLKM